jgi:hypothetical protein
MQCKAFYNFSAPEVTKKDRVCPWWEPEAWANHLVGVFGFYNGSSLKNNLEKNGGGP